MNIYSPPLALDGFNNKLKEEIHKKVWVKVSEKFT
jgi:hypothetical protein